ncbi:MAG: DUF2752 domain-containing protein [Kribbellaceae bacterium]|nr:DUF2752 domain-containing protein [Catenulispora sp.]NUR99640.1 DUF2752 domain-containing protein [Kribbellaceae bacterium]
MVVAIERTDRLRTYTRIALVALAAGLGLLIVGVPTVDLHGPLHYFGIMDPLCGGTRAMYLLGSGDFAGAARYNPIVFPIAVVIPALALRAVVGWFTGRWLTFLPSRRVRVGIWIVAAVLLVALEIRQQSHAALLMQGWPLNS